MLVVTSFVGIPMCYTFSRNTLVTWDLGRILVIFMSYLACKYGVNRGNWLTCL
jgi:TRAP-type C4-dicarboxylate transport system permease small subunit